MKQGEKQEMNRTSEEVDNTIRWATVLYKYDAQHESEISLDVGTLVILLHKTTDELFWYVQNEEGKQGYIQADYLEENI